MAKREIAKMLLERKVDVNVKGGRDSDESTPLHQAVIFDSQDSIPLLLDYHAEIKIKDRNGLTPIALAVHRAEPEMVKIFLTHKFQVILQSSAGVRLGRCR